MKKIYFFIVFIFLIQPYKSEGIDSLLFELNGLKNNEEKIEFIYKAILNKKTSKESQKKFNAILDSFSVYSKNEKEKGLALQKKGYVANRNREYNDALINLFKALKIFEKLNDASAESKIHMEIGRAYQELKNFPSAIAHVYSSMDLNQTANNKNLRANAHCVLGNIFKDESEIDSSLNHHKTSLQLYVELNDSSGIATAYNDIGLTYKRENKYDLALEYLIKGLKIREGLKNERGIAGANINIGNTLKHLKRYDDAIPYYNKGIEIAENSGNTDFYLNGLIGRAKNAKLSGDFKQSSLDYGLYIALKDSLYKQELSKQLAELDISYQSEKKDSEIALQQEQLKSQLAENSKQKIMILTSGVALLMMIVAVFFIFRSYKQNKRNAGELSIKNHLIEEKNREITDSINYAKLIQQSLLASKEMLDKNLESYFILYKPKDIVSGDFYWASETDKGFLVACVDCTGHGVPGAFMSLIGKENLDKALAKTTNPGEILNELNKNVKKSLNQTATGGSRDGMDAAIIRVEKNKSGNAEITYAGANRPLYILKRETNSIEEVKATKQAIGGFTAVDQLFTEHKVKINKGDTVVIATDGFADQFGSDNNKKLTTKRFKELLISVQSKSASEQKQNLEDFFTKWKGNYEQLDDLLIIGINI